MYVWQALGEAYAGQLANRCHKGKFIYLLTVNYGLFLFVSRLEVTNHYQKGMLVVIIVCK